MVKIPCAPKKNDDDCSHTCFKREDLVKMAKILNKKGKKVKINKRTKHELWNDIKSEMGKKCDDMCLLKKLKGGNPDEVFRPKMPEHWKKNMNEWLSTTDINRVLNQYQKKYPKFLFFGAVPADCPVSFTCSLSNINIKKLKKEGKTKLGVVYNMDTHNKPGSHWVAMFIDLDTNEVDYYDSYGDDIETAPIRKFKNKMMKMLGKDAVYKYNNKRHQFKDSECGIFSIKFIEYRLKGRNMEYIKKVMPNDEKVQKQRKKYYRMK